MSSVVASRQLVSENKQIAFMRIQPWLVCFGAALFFFFEFVQMNMFNPVGPYLAKSFHMDASVLATISDKYFLANIIFLFPAGMLLDRISTRKAIIVGMLVSVACTFWFAGADAIWQMKLARFITGIAGSFCLLSCVRIASRWFKPRQMALIVGLIVTFAMLGGMVAQTPFAVLVNAFGWRMTVIIDACFGLLLLLFIWIFVKDRPRNSESDDPHAGLSGAEFWMSLKKTIANRQNWFCGLYTSLMNLPVFLLGALWGIFYLTQVKHLSNDVASMITSLFFVGVIIGSPVAGWVSDFLRQRKMPMILGAIVSLALVLILMFDPSLSVFSLTTLFFGLGFFTSTQIISYPLIAESNPLSLTATAEGMASVLIMSGGFAQDLFAYLIRWGWDHHYSQGVPLYSTLNYQVGMAIMPIAFIISLIISLFLRETHCKPFQSQKTI